MSIRIVGGGVDSDALVGAKGAATAVGEWLALVGSVVALILGARLVLAPRPAPARLVTPRPEPRSWLPPCKNAEPEQPLGARTARAGLDARERDLRGGPRSVRRHHRPAGRAPRRRCRLRAPLRRPRAPDSRARAANGPWLALDRASRDRGRPRPGGPRRPEHLQRQLPRHRRLGRALHPHPRRCARPKRVRDPGFRRGTRRAQLLRADRARRGDETRSLARALAPRALAGSRRCPLCRRRGARAERHARERADTPVGRADRRHRRGRPGARRRRRAVAAPPSDPRSERSLSTTRGRAPGRLRVRDARCRRARNLGRVRALDPRARRRRVARLGSAHARMDAPRHRGGRT